MIAWGSFALGFGSAVVVAVVIFCIGFWHVSKEDGPDIL